MSTTVNIHEMSEWIFSCFSSPADRPWSICRHRPLSFHAHCPNLIPDITSHQNDCGCLPFPLMEPLLPLLPTLPVSAVNPRPVLQGLAEALPPNPQGLLHLPSFPSELHPIIFYYLLLYKNLQVIQSDEPFFLPSVNYMLNVIRFSWWLKDLNPISDK